VTWNDASQKGEKPAFCAPSQCSAVATPGLTSDSGVRQAPFSAACALGVFDGFHRGHQCLLSELKADAAAAGVPAWVITFDRDPDELFVGEGRLNKLMTDADRLRHLARSGVDGVFVVPFGKELANMAPDCFCDTVLASLIAPHSIHVGTGFRYGAQAAGTTASLASWVKARGGRLCEHHLFDEDGEPVSATRIRSELRRGHVADAARLLTRPFYLRGTVVAGRGAGTALGIPTANLRPDLSPSVLSEGVYAAYVFLDNRCLRAAVSVGAPTTFGINEPAIEPHLLDFDEDIYGKEVVISFVSFLRPMRTFKDATELQRVVSANIAWVRENL
jgi:riboflavin kinase/FMN adenylyltransferase